MMFLSKPETQHSSELASKDKLHFLQIFLMHRNSYEGNATWKHSLKQINKNIFQNQFGWNQGALLVLLYFLLSLFLAPVREQMMSVLWCWQLGEEKTLSGVRSSCWWFIVTAGRASHCASPNNREPYIKVISRQSPSSDNERCKDCYHSLERCHCSG